MALEPMQQLISRALQGGYALGYFESWNLESLQGVLDAAEHTRSPIIVGFNGEFLSSSDRVVAERLELFAALGVAAAEKATVPCALIFNECSRDDWVRRAAELGFNCVMLADPTAEHDQYQRRVADIVRHAHQRGVAVEAELGELPCGASGHVHGTSAKTDPQRAAHFIESTAIDLLAVSVGNVHILTVGQRDLDLDHLAALHQRISIPLVLHGGTGISEASLRQAIRMGVAKVNYGTYLKQRALRAMRTLLADHEQASNPHALLGMGGANDLMTATRLAVRDAVLERIESLGCCGKADP